MVTKNDIPGRQQAEGQEQKMTAMVGEVDRMTLRVLETLAKASPSFEIRRRALNKARRLLGKG